MLFILRKTSGRILCALLTTLFVLQFSPARLTDTTQASRQGVRSSLFTAEVQAAQTQEQASGKAPSGADRPTARKTAQAKKQNAVLLDPSLVREGDVLFQITNSPQCKAIQMATGSRYTHCGIVLKKDGELQVFEAVRTVSWSPLQEWLRRGVNKHYVLMRLKNPALLSAAQLAAMRQDTKFFNGRGYDIFFQWGDDEIYCSELVWKLYQRNAGIELGPLRTFRDYNLDHAEVQRIARERFGRDIPLDSKVTAPSDIMECDLLEVVAEN